MSASALPPEAIASARDAVKVFLRTEAATEDALLGELAASAMLTAEPFLGALLIARACDDVIAADGAWRMLSAAPVLSITSVAGIGDDGGAIMLPVDAYAVEIDAAARGWARVRGTEGAPRARVSYTAGGASDWASVPAPIAQGIVLLAAHLFNDREAASLPPAAVSALWRPFRRLRLGDGR